MSTKTKSTAVAKLSDNPMQIINLLDQKISDMQKIEDTKWKTSGNISAFGMNVDLKTETKLENIIKVVSSLLGQQKAYNEAMSALKLKTAPAFTINGHLVEDWVSDAKLRIAINNQQEELDTLRKFKEQASEFITKDEKKAHLMSQMEEYFKSK